MRNQRSHLRANNLQLPPTIAITLRTRNSRLSAACAVCSLKLPPKETRTDHRSLSSLSNREVSLDICVRFLEAPSPHFTEEFLASLCQTASYVDIVAKTDTYVGFLPSPALERLLERRPIVQLTLAKRLISLLSPLGASTKPTNSTAAH